MNPISSLQRELVIEAHKALKVFKEEAYGTPFNKSYNYGRMERIWEAALPLIQNAEAGLEQINISNGTIAERIDSVLLAVSERQVTLAEGKRLIEMLQAGFEITELQDLINKLGEAGVDLGK